MKHTDLNIFRCATVAAEKLRKEGQELTLRLICNAVEHWETIRPKDDDAQLLRTNHALAQQVADLQKELVEVRECLHSAEKGEKTADSLLEVVLEALHRYHLALDRREGTYLAADKFAADVGQALGRPWVYGNAKRREEDNQLMDAPQPTPDDLERREFEAWAITQTYYLDWNGVAQYCNLRTHRAWQAWKAARANSTTPKP